MQLLKATRPSHFMSSHRFELTSWPPRSSIRAPRARLNALDTNASASVQPPEASAHVPLPPSSFRRLVARKTGPSFSAVAEVEELPMLQPKEGEVLIKVAYAGINGGCETFRSRGEFAFSGNKNAPMFTLGAEGAGQILRVGPGVTQLTAGQHVTFIGGAFSEYVTAKAMLCWPVPRATPESVALTISGTVANAALKYVGKIQPSDTVLVTAAAGATGSFAVQLAKAHSDTVLVTAAAGATGSFAVQLAKAHGCRVIATCGTDEKYERLQDLGIDRVINYKREDVESVLKQEFGSEIDVAYEGVGGRMQALAWDALKRPGGRLLAVGYISEYPHNTNDIIKTEKAHQQHSDGLPPSSELFWGGQNVTPADGRVAYGKVWPAERAETLKAKAEVFEMHNNGQLQAWVDTTHTFYGVEQVPAAVEWMLSGQAIGKVVVKMD